ncbi:MAG: carbohydrate-binding family 9-like protein [Sediminibacterium sp.]|nr:carbohydrate-binding family 9-like protein [Sediminibacterium sp.]
MRSKLLFQPKTSALMGLLLLFCAVVKAQTVLSSSLHSEKKYTARMAKRPIKVDGKLNEHDWKQAVLISNFEDIEGAAKPKPTFSTEVKMMWDSQYLYIGAVLEEPHLWGTLKKHDDIIYRDHDFEVFIDPMGDGEQYFEIEINVLGTIMDLFMNKPYKKGGTFDMGWNTAGIQSKIIANGTINDNTDIDSGWTLEMAIPFTAISKAQRAATPSFNKPWRINFSRVQWTLEPDGISYRKKLNQNNKPISEHNWVWNPTGVVDMHVPAKWGYLYFKN